MPHRKQAWSKRVRKERFKKKYLSRMQATRLLQLDAIHFRRLCILKGIYPRALPTSKQKQSGNEKQYYLAREIKWAVHDHLTERMAAQRAWEKKVKRAQAMGRKDHLRTLSSALVKPRHSLVATIKERYPYFVDAVRDVDDAMSMILLYAFLSPEVRSDSNVEVPHSLTSALHEKAVAISSQWNDYVTRARVLTRGFISVKGYYYEALVKGERVRWLCPHEYAHKFPKGIQQFILLSFLEFYLEMMRFVLYKLNADLKRELEEEERAEADGEVNTNAEDFTRETTLTAVATTGTAIDGNGEEKAAKKSTVADPKRIREAANKLCMVDEELRKVRSLFRGLTFFISREVPAKHAKLVIESCGGRVAAEYQSGNLTHVVMDRPALPPGMAREDHLEYVQPQYLFDCLNSRVLLPVNGYRLGEDLPPHVSPFTVPISNTPEDVAAVEDTKKAHPKIVSYVPARVHEIRKFINPAYVPEDPEGKVAEMLLRQELEDGEGSDVDHHAAVPELDADDDVALSDEELAEASRRPAWEEEEVTENVERTKLSAFKVKKQRELNQMNAPTDEVVARRRQAALKAKEASRKGESTDARVRRKLTEAKKQEAATRKMQLQVARKKAARYYKMVNGVVQGTAKKAAMLEAKAKHLDEGKLKKTEDGTGLLNTRVEAKRMRAEARGRKQKERKASNPYRKLPKWVQ